MGSEESQTLQVTGMTCQNCVRHVEQALRATPGVTDAKVDLKRETAMVRNRPGLQRTALVEAIKGAGYGVRDSTPTPEPSRWKLWRR